MAIIVIGNPNVGKSAALNRLSGSNILVSNYPGTSTEISANSVKIGKKEITVFDTPGIYSIFSEGEEQKAIRDLFAMEEIDLILNIVDASNLERNLVLSYELMDLGFPVLLLLNQIDRARSLGIRINERLLSELLQIPVIPFSATTGEGLQEVLKVLERTPRGKKDALAKEESQEKKESQFREVSPVGKESLAQERCFTELRTGQCNGHCGLCSIPATTCMSIADWGRVEKARTTADMVSSNLGERQRILLEKTQAFFDSSLWGTPVLLFLAYLAFVLLLKFVAISEGPITALLEPLNQTIESFLSQILPPGIINTVLSKAIPEGLIIPFSIIMPAMLMVACIMSLLEDSGLLPRYSVALERAG
ncbi:MAG: FeoB small GTPase domain-containing protein, partial [Syntrophomonas sp.]|nr:FeoB small GTPase domain-containing protein [Syntrophomonas sp.]